MIKDDTAERTEQPTPSRLAEARRNGQVARSGELASALVVLGTAAVLSIVAPAMLQHATGLVQNMLTSASSRESAASSLLSEALPLALDVGILAASAVALAIAASLLQTGFVANPAALSVQASRMSPVGNLRRVFSLRGLARSLQTLLKVAIIAGLAYLTIRPALSESLGITVQPVWRMVESSGGMVGSLLIRVGLAMAALGVLDYLYQRWQHSQDLKMTPRQLREELKRDNGDPQLRNRRRQVSRRQAAASPQAMRQASVLITGRGGLAVAIRFAAPMRAPVMSAKASAGPGSELVELARSCGVPMVEDDELSLAIYRGCRSGQAVAGRHHEQLAEILAFAEQTRGQDDPETREPGVRVARRQDACDTPDARDMSDTQGAHA